MSIHKLTDADFSLMLLNFSLKLDQYSTLLNISQDETKQANDDAHFYQYCLALQNSVAKHSTDITAFKNELRHSSSNGNTVTLPSLVAPNLPAGLTNTLLPDIEGRTVKLINRIKNSVNYTTAIGNDLGIETPNSSAAPKDYSTLTPVLKLHQDGNQVKIDWQKQGAEGIEIHKSVNGSPFHFLLIATHSPALDTDRVATPEMPELWKYKAIYRIKDHPTGLWSSEFSITVV